jgi:hypothetical protein
MMAVSLYFHTDPYICRNLTDTMKSRFEPIRSFCIVACLLMFTPDLTALPLAASLVEARVSTGLSVLMALGLIYGSWRLMGVGRKE